MVLRRPGWRYPGKRLARKNISRETIGLRGVRAEAFTWLIAG
ncbi:hypothetical protein JOM49_003186 [Amycolatopsis magusensis]|uniref:Uncharacterized protein n=1 Tax=Amycolatopsis magusensis TaxID=882444 RepID=A0ABS4PQG8_9PSEU|nr:hypothetical protein [Amycolatopsis magusensis]